MAPIRILCPQCSKKYYPEWFPTYPRPDALCYMCLTASKLALLENQIAFSKNDTERMKIENTQLRLEIIQLKEEI